MKSKTHSNNDLSEDKEYNDWAVKAINAASAIPLGHGLTMADLSIATMRAEVEVKERVEGKVNRILQSLIKQEEKKEEDKKRSFKNG